MTANTECLRHSWLLPWGAKPPYGLRALGAAPWARGRADCRGVSVSSVSLWCLSDGGGVSPQRHKDHRAGNTRTDRRRAAVAMGDDVSGGVCLPERANPPPGTPHTAACACGARLLYGLRALGAAPWARGRADWRGVSVSSVPLWCLSDGGGVSPQRHKDHRAGNTRTDRRRAVVAMGDDVSGGFGPRE